MKKIILMSVMLVGVISAKSQITITSDSLITNRLEATQERYIPISRHAESLSLEIDKDLMTLRVFGKGHEHAAVETAYLLDLLSVNDNMQKWIFLGEDKNCISYTITLDVIKKRIEFLTFRKDTSNYKSLTMFYYPIVDIAINKDAINRHLEEKNRNQ